MTAVMIGTGPRKPSHTAVVISDGEEPPGELRVRAGARKPSGCWNGPRPGRNGPGQLKGPEA